MTSQSPPIVVISGASGSGKTTLCRMISKQLGLYYSVSHTTRPKRANEIDGRDYHFITNKEFDKIIKGNGFLEWAEVYGNRYGTSRAEIDFRLGQGQGVILDLDTQGALSIKREIPRAFLVFVKAPSHEHLEERLVRRGSETEEHRKLRLQQVRHEETFMDQYDRVLINEHLDETLNQLQKLIESRFPVHAQT